MIECPECPKLGSYVDGTPIRTQLFSYPQLALHLVGHKQTHDYGESLEFFSFKLFKQFNLIGRYVTWKNWDSHLFRYINWPEYNWIYELWQQSIRNSCRNSPCFECEIKRINKMKSYQAIKQEIHRRGFIKRPNGVKIPLPVVSYANASL